MFEPSPILQPALGVRIILFGKNPGQKQRGGKVAKTVLNYRECSVSTGLSIKIDRKDDNDIDCIG